MPRPAVAALLVVLAAAPLSAQFAELRYPPVGGGQIRVEGYLVPAVTSWPAYPAWSPDGRTIAFAMDGDLWLVPVEGGVATRLAASPGYDFEPDWSPDGRTIAFSRDVGGNVDVYVVPRTGGAARRLTEDAALEFHPRFDAAGRIVYTSAASGGLDVAVVEPGAAPRPRLAWPTQEIQPEPSPVDPNVLAVVSTRSGRIGSGGLWLVRGDTAREILFEETTYRTRPAFSPDGKTIAFVSDRAGTNDIWLVGADENESVPVRVTWDDEADETAPSWSPAGDALVYVTNRGGRGALEIVPLHGGRVRPVPIAGRRYGAPRGTLRLVLAHPLRLTVLGADGRAYAPAGVFRRVVSFTETHYFHADAGTVTIDVPAGPVEVRASRGPEYAPRVLRVEVPAGGVVERSLALEHRIDAAAEGWVSGDTHVHDLHAGDVRLAPEALVLQAAAEDVRVVNALVHVDGTKIMGDPRRFVAGPHPASRDGVLLRYGQEYRMPFGHRTILNLEALFFPLVAGLDATPRRDPYPALFDYLRRLEADQPGVLAGVPHPYFGYLARGELAPPRAPSEIPVDVALGLVDFFDVNCIWSDERGAAAIYARLLNAGFRLPAAGGSDTFSDVWRDPPLGTGRTYVKLEGPFTLDGWYDGLRAGRSFSTNGPLLELEVGGRGMGEELRLDGPGSVRVRARARSVVPIDRLDVVVNGRAAQSVEAAPGGGTELVWEGELALDESAWIAVRAEGGSSPWVTDSYLYAHSSPVYVLVAGGPILVEADRAYLERYVESLVAAAAALDWTDPARREAALAGFREALEVLRRRPGAP